MIISAPIQVLDRVRQHARDCGYVEVKFPWKQAISGNLKYKYTMYPSSLT